MCEVGYNYVGRHLSSYFYTVAFDRKDCYDTERDMLAIAKFFVCFGVTKT